MCDLTDAGSSNSTGLNANGRNAGNDKLFALGPGCLALAFLLPMLFHPAGQTARNLLHFVCGLLLGMSVSISLALVWKKSRQRRLSGPRL